MENKIKVNSEYPYLSNVKAPVQLLGLAPLLNPLTDHVSAQRLTMWSSHLTQAQLIHGCEFPRVYSGYESIVGEYEYDPSYRDQDIQILATIPRFIKNTGPSPILENPYYTIVYREAGGGDPANQKVGYFHFENDCMRSDGYGYEFKKMNEFMLTVGNIIPKEVKFLTSPAHQGSMYNLGTNLNTCYLDIPEVTEDAFVVSESAAKKLGSTGYSTRSFKILPNQFPLGLYSSDTEYKFMPDIGEKVRDDGVLCAFRTPDEDSIIYDTLPTSLHKVQYMHDKVFYAPPGAEIVDIDIVINRKVRPKTPKVLFAQVTKYRNAINEYCLKVWDIYRQITKEGKKITPDFKTLVTRCLASAIIDGVQIPNLGEKFNLKPYKKKDEIEFIYITVKYKYNKPAGRGYKITGRSGNKGTISQIVPDDQMPVDEFGIRADMIGASISIFNRMNPSCWFEVFIGRMSEFVRRQVEALAKTDKAAAFNHLIEYLTDCNCNYGKLVAAKHPTPTLQNAFVDEVIRDGIYVQLTPFTEGIDEIWAQKMTEKYQVKSSPVTYYKKFPDGKLHKITTKRPVLIGPQYTYRLYKEPHERSAGLGYVNQYRSPMKSNDLAKAQYPISQTAIRLGEDEIRNIVMTSGAEVAAHIAGVYANSPDAVENLATHLLTDEHPSQLKSVDLSLPEIINSNIIVGVAKHIFATVGINISPSEEEVRSLLGDEAAIATATDEVDEIEEEEES